MKTALFTGTFDPFTIGHHSVVTRALPLFDRIVIGVGVNERKQTRLSAQERREAIEDGAHISCGWGPKEVHLDETGRVCGITFKRCTRVYDDEGRFAPEYDENDLRRVDADRVVMSIGQSIV